jgi:hypothetical protein
MMTARHARTRRLCKRKSAGDGSDTRGWSVVKTFMHSLPANDQLTDGGPAKRLPNRPGASRGRHSVQRWVRHPG